MKMFAIINGIVGFALLSLCSTRPLKDVFTEASHQNSVKSPEAINKVHTSKSLPVRASHSRTIQRRGTLSLQTLEVDRTKVEESLRELGSNRIPGEHSASWAPPPTHAEDRGTPIINSGPVSQAVPKTVRGIKKEIEAYKALARGRVKKANQLLQEATTHQQQAFSAGKDDKTAFLLGLCKHKDVQKQAEKLKEQIEEYKLLPTARELLAAFHSLDKDFPPKVSTTTPARNHDISTSVNDQHTPSSAMNPDPLTLVQHQNGESSLKNQDRPSVVNAPKKTKLQKAFGFLSRWYRSFDKSRLQTRLSSLAALLKANEVEVLRYLKIGDRAGALKKIKSMRQTRKNALRIYADYRASGYGTIDFENRPGCFYKMFQDVVVDTWDDMEPIPKITGERLENIKKIMELQDKGPKP